VLVGANGAPVATAQALDLPETDFHGETIGFAERRTTLERGMPR
jgi:hypothetical protein